MSNFVDFKAMTIDELDEQIASWRELAHNAGKLRSSRSVFRCLKMLDIAVAVKRQKLRAAR
jgi:hypothetical protein